MVRTAPRAVDRSSPPSNPAWVPGGGNLTARRISVSTDTPYHLPGRCELFAEFIGLGYPEYAQFKKPLVAAATKSYSELFIFLRIVIASWDAFIYSFQAHSSPDDI